jgi:N-acetyl-alpha-D-glucosaminyl L-malate synthase BshA
MQSPLRIGILCHPTYGGSGVVASELALSLAERGHRVHLFSNDVPPRLARSSGPVEMHVAQGVPYPLFHSTPHDLAITSSVLDVHRSEGLDVLHAHYALPHAVSGFLARSAAQTDEGRQAPVLVTTLHGTDITLVGNDASYAPLTRFVIETSDAVTAVSESLARQTRENFCGGRIECPIEVIPNFVDTHFFRPAEKVQGTPTAVHVSNFRRVKRVPWMIRAFARAVGKDEARLTLIGDGPDQAASRALAGELDLCERVCFLGLRDALPALLAPARVFLLSSSEESFGLSALESMSCGTPVVSTDVGGVSEVVEHGVSGLLSPVDDLDAYAANLRSLLFDPERAAAFGQNARERAVQNFGREKLVVRYEELYRRTLSRTRAGAAAS